ncbi:MAG: TRAP transporter permease [Thermofilaceae archaeon]
MEKGNKILSVTISAIAVSWSIFQLYGIWYPLYPWKFNALHVMFAIILTFLLYPARKKGKIGLSNILLAALTIPPIAWIFIDFEQLLFRTFTPTLIDIILGATFIALVIEATRRTVGWPLATIALFFLLYCYFGAGFNFTDIIGFMYIGMEGVFGLPAGVSAKWVFIFILFAAFLRQTGLGEFFIELANALVGHTRGGPAKISVISSASFGTISGSAVANVVATGVFTIPMMKKLGYKPEFAGAVEAVASSGGQLMPPIMGAAAFLMADILGLPYVYICIAALIPAFLYFFTVGLIVHLEAIRLGLKGLPKEQRPSLRKLLFGRGFLLMPIIIIFYLLISGYTPMYAAFWAIVATIILSMVRKETRLNIGKLLKALESGAKDAITVAAACASAGIISGSVMLTGLAIRFTETLTTIFAGNLIPMLIVIMIICVILGCGLPTTAAYIVASIFCASALIELGVKPLAAHMFIFYFAILAAITPPVALASYAGAGIASADSNKTSFNAIRMALIAYIMPYVFVFRPALLSQSHLQDILWVTFVFTIGTIAFSCGIWNVFIKRMMIIERVLLIIAAILLFFPDLMTDIIGLMFFLIVTLLNISEILNKRRLISIKI